MVQNKDKEALSTAVINISENYDEEDTLFERESYKSPLKL